eukprot:scaffold402865_cov42-Prasinocladus_malaysianus.AAC.1
MLSELLSTTKATLMQATPATWRNLIAVGWAGMPRTLRGLCGGEALPIDLMRGLLPTRLKELWNVYGPTETTVWSTSACLRHGTEVVHIGKPIANTQVYVLDEHLNPVPTGIAGELFIGGDGVSPGYLERPDLTAELQLLWRVMAAVTVMILLHWSMLPCIVACSCVLFCMPVLCCCGCLDLLTIVVAAVAVAAC